jgi:ribosomal RNA methyltransferase Nop2
MGYKAKNKQGAPEPLEKPTFDGPSKRAKARLNKAKAAAAEKKSDNKKRQNTAEEPKKNNKKAKTSKPAAREEPEEDLWDNLEVASDDNSDAENDEFDMSDFENAGSDNDIVEEQEESEEEEEEEEIFPQAEGGFLGSDSEEEMELDQEEEEEDEDEYDSDEIAEVYRS